MDKTKTYIKMSDCLEVQKYRKKQKDFQIGDLIANYKENGKKRFLEVVIWELNDKVGNRELATWLPRQDDIQKMIEGHKKPHYLIVSFINFMQEQQKFYKSGRVKKLYPVGSMEQLWLAFYMYENHKKVWDSAKGIWRNYK